MIRLKIRDNYFKIIDGYQVNESSREVKFSSLKVDFTNKTIADLPLKYQECQLVEGEFENILPSGYTQVDYIESSGTQYIDTEYIANTSTEVHTKFLLNNKNKFGLYGGQITGKDTNLRFFADSGSLYIAHGGNRRQQVNNLEINIEYELQHKKSECVINGVQYISSGSNDFQRTTLTICKCNGFDINGYFLNGRIYYFKIYDSGTLVRNFIPCYRNSDNKVGLYDLVNNVFYANQGTGEFTYGTKIEPENNIIYTGYVNNFTLPKMKNRNEYRELELDLLSPLAMATVRTVDAVGTYELQSLVRELIQPLIDDGFVLKEMNIGNNQITVNFLSETVESSLNKLSNKFNFWWYIDANKNIYINSITYLMSLKPKLTYDDSNPIKGLIDVIPSIDATDYCNVVNFTNLRLFTESFFQRAEVPPIYNDESVVSYQEYNPIKHIDYINSGQEIEFDIPFDITINNYFKNENKKTYTRDDVFFIEGYYYENGSYSKSAKITIENNQLVLTNNLSISDSYSDENEWVLVRDAFFKNLIIGLKYNGEQKLTVNKITAFNALAWSNVKVINNDEVYKNKNIISKSGVVEKTIDMNEQWKTYEEILDIANSYVKKNNSRADEVKLNVDYDADLKIGDTVKINKDSFLIQDTYIITDKVSAYSNNVNKWSYTLRNTNILENYVDLFRTSEQEEDNKTFNLITANYSEDNIIERYEVTHNED